MYNFAGDFVSSKSFSYCTLRQWQDGVVQNFGCTISNLLVISDPSHIYLPKCRQLSPSFTKDELNTIINLNKFLLGRDESIIKSPSNNNNNKSGSSGGEEGWGEEERTMKNPKRKCYESCEELRFKYSFSSVPLDKQLSLNLYNFADNSTAMKRYLESSSTFEECMNSTSNYSSCFGKVAKSSYKDLIQLEIQQDTQSGGLIEFDVPQFELADFLAKLAATVNFWVGVSAIFCIELFDILLQIILSFEFSKL